MAAILFDKRDREYIRWLKKHPDGYVVNTRRGISPKYMSLHRATCRKISTYAKNMSDGAFTERMYAKICASNPDELLAWIRQHKGVKFSTICSVCHPPETSSAEAYYHQLAQQLASRPRSARGKVERRKRQERLRHAPVKPARFTTTTTIFDRNKDVIDEVLANAKGVCGLCGKPAPFYKANTKEPYLEVHHKRPLAKGGQDTVKNSVALCPNCHREAHYG